MGITGLSSYKTVMKPSEIEIIEKRSRFIGRCYPVTTEEEAISKLEQIRKENWNASHNCYAYILNNGLARYSDDGEPSGTAGMPIIETMKHKGITDAIVIVTRYFGGILLGTGGLVRAYSKTASEAINASQIIEMIPCTAFSVDTSYTYWNTVKSVCEKYGSIDTIDYTESVNCIVWVKNQDSERFVLDLCDKTEGRIIPVNTGDGWFPFPSAEE